MKKFSFFFFLFVLISGVVSYFILTYLYPQTPPILAAGYYIESMVMPHAKLNKEVIGFLPYWQAEEIKHVRPQLLSEINYFSLNLADDGHIAKIENGETDPGWRVWQQDDLKNFMVKSHIMGTKNSVTIAVLDNQKIMDFLDNKDSQRNLIEDLLSEIKARQLDGITIDFEYTGEPATVYNYAFSNFSKQLKLILKSQYPKLTLSLSLMPLAGREDNLYDFERIEPYYDRFIGMSYEYYGAGADIAGPIAPIHGFKEGSYFFDVSTTYEDYAKLLPKEKIIMGVPSYGREWAVKDGATKNSRTYASGSEESYAAILSFARAKESTDIKKSQCQWDALAQETWCWFTDKKSGVDHQLWLSDKKSIQTRFDFAESQKLAGVAIWTLGYDKQYSDIWDTIAATFSKK